MSFAGIPISSPGASQRVRPPNSAFQGFSKICQQQTSQSAQEQCDLNLIGAALRLHSCFAHWMALLSLLF